MLQASGGGGSQMWWAQRMAWESSASAAAARLHRHMRAPSARASRSLLSLAAPSALAPTLHASAAGAQIAASCHLHTKASSSTKCPSPASTHFLARCGVVIFRGGKGTCDGGRVCLAFFVVEASERMCACMRNRCIQRSDQPIILTGYAALNKLLGREVYTSHMQLGGPKVMAVNGVSHHVVEDDLAGCAAVLQWLAFVPVVLGSQPPTLASSDPIERPISYIPRPGA